MNMDVPKLNRIQPPMCHNSLSIRNITISLQKIRLFAQDNEWWPGIKPDAAFCDSNNGKDMKKTLMFGIGIIAALNASAQITYTGTSLSGLIYSGGPGEAQYVAGTPDVAQLYTADLSTSGDSPAVFALLQPGITLNSFVASYVAGSGTTVDPYFILYLTDDPGFGAPIVATDSGNINGSSLIHEGDLVDGSMTLSALDSVIDPLSGQAYGDDTVAYVGLEIGDSGSGAGTANITSLTVPNAAAVPEASTYMAGAMLLLPLGMSTLRKLRKKQTA
jgi:hypothetical protein